MKRRWTTLVAGTLFLSACGIVKLAPPKQRGRTHYDSAECHKRTWRKETEVDSVLMHTCDNLSEVPDESTSLAAMLRRHQSFEDRRPDSLDVALNLVECAQHCGNDPMAIAIGNYYAGIFDRTALGERLRGIELSEPARAVFANKASDAKDAVAAAASRLDARRKHIYLESFAEAVRNRKEYFAKYSEQYQALDTLEEKVDAARKAGEAPKDLVDGLSALRAKYVSQCQDDGCRFDPYVVEVTRQLVLLHAAAGNALDARAENALLMEKAAGRRWFSVEAGTAVYQSQVEEHRIREQYVSAQNAGMDARTLKERFGYTTPLQIEPVAEYLQPDVRPDLTSTVDGFDTGSAIKRRGGLLAEIAPGGEGRTRVVLAPAAGLQLCAETGRVADVHFEENFATLEFETTCEADPNQVTATTTVLLPSPEASQLRPGEYAELVADDHQQGRVVRAWAANPKAPKQLDRVAQLRDARFETR
ncbi:MAG: hypothetical protein KC776_40560 [Myxococcales bacterium]|nr:hypothetical protein [Myxococcales bacterium]MCB9581865.1 hypothetical protein [Polyangiaceae bacterium]